jgi:hypothetical protein
MPIPKPTPAVEPVPKPKPALIKTNETDEYTKLVNIVKQAPYETGWYTIPRLPLVAYSKENLFDCSNMLAIMYDYLKSKGYNNVKVAFGCSPYSHYCHVWLLVGEVHSITYYNDHFVVNKTGYWVDQVNKRVCVNLTDCNSRIANLDECYVNFRFYDDYRDITRFEYEFYYDKERFKFD